jgi:signal transduction histidine kinase
MQILLNLQSNALKFTERGKVEIFAKIEDRGDERYLEISVTDSGSGISE